MRRLAILFFDVDDTVYPSTGFAERARRVAVEAMIAAGLRAEPEHVLERLGEVIAEHSSNYEYQFDELLRQLGSERHPGVNPAMIIAAGVVAYHDTKFRELTPYPDALEVLRVLARERGLRVGVITEGRAVKQAEKLIRLGFAKFIDPGAVFISEQLGRSKAEPEFYRRVLEELRLEPAETICVGDNPSKDIDPAKEAGMITVLQKRGGKYEGVSGRTRPDYEVRNFNDLLGIIEKDFEIAAR